MAITTEGWVGQALTTVGWAATAAVLAALILYSSVRGSRPAAMPRLRGSRGDGVRSSRQLAAVPKSDTATKLQQGHDRPAPTNETFPSRDALAISFFFLPEFAKFRTCSTVFLQNLRKNH